MFMDLVGMLDIAAFILSAALGKLLYVVLQLDTVRGLETYLATGLAGGVAFHYIARRRGLHEPAAFLEWQDRLSELLISIGLSLLMLLAIAFLLKISAEYPRGWLITWFMLVALFLAASRPAYRYLLLKLDAGGHTARRIAVVDTGGTGEKVAHALRGMPGIQLAGIFADTAAQGQPVPYGNLADLINVGQRNEVDEVVIAVSGVPQRETARMVEQLSVLPVDVWLCPAEFEMPILATSRLGALSLLQIKPKPIRDWGYVLKLLIDYTVGALCLLLFAPLMLMIAAAIKIDSRGPVFFRQRRHGFNHRVIDVFKFRTMTVAENGDRVDQARKNDPRVTRVGRFLRRTSLDELPQLFNVMKGEMSLVGPRPHALTHNQHYRERLDRYASRHCVKPGMTGWAQINGLRGPTEDLEKMRLRVHMDLYYIENWSLWLDLKIIAATPFVGFIHRNAL
jgi:putative colanic acid biosynthesis UDP-glucose lipid carrier transferase